MLDKNYYENNKEKINLGIELLFENLSKTFIIFIIALFTGTLKETIISILVFASMRYYSFGIHSKSSNVCLIISILMHNVGPLIACKIIVNKSIYYLIFTIIIILLLLYSPSDTENHPLVNKDLRTKLKIKSVLLGIILFLISLMIGSETIKNIIIFNLIYVVFGILPLTYKILNRRYHNYENYK